MTAEGFAVPADETPHVCERCGRPYARADHLALHRGLAHGADLSASERTALEAARTEEQAAIRKFRLKALGALVALYFGFLMVYAVV